MAKITIAGEACVVTSTMKVEDIRTIQKYRPDALILKGGEDGSEPIFRIGLTDDSTGCINRYGAEFYSETHDAEGRATMTLICRAEGDIKEAVADTIGAYVMTLNKLEETLPAVLAEIETEKAEILANIEVIG